MPQLSVFLLFLLFTIVRSENNITWANLTATELGQLDPTQFKNITEQELGSIPAIAFSGFTRDQVAAIPSSAAPGFSSYQVAQFTSYVFALLSLIHQCLCFVLFFFFCFLLYLFSLCFFTKIIILFNFILS
jgi:hypothetical protein